MNNLVKSISFLAFLLIANFQTATAQTLKTGPEKINSFTQLATSPEVRMLEGDYNGDGRSDVALVRQTSGWATIPVAFSNGDGTFTITNQVTNFAKFAVNQTYVSKGDFNGDGRTDIALLGKKGSGWGSIVIAFSNGDGTFKTTNKQADVFYQNYLTAESVTILTGDYNGDGKDDFSFFSQNSAWETAPLAISNGDGTFTQVAR